MLNKDKLKLYEGNKRQKFNSREGNWSHKSHSGYRRGFFKLDYGNHVFVFYPFRFWASKTGLSDTGIRAMLTSGILTMYKKSGIPIISNGELALLKHIANKHQVTAIQNAVKNDGFIHDIKYEMALFRNSMDQIKYLREVEYYSDLHKEFMQLNLNDKNRKL